MERLIKPALDGGVPYLNQDFFNTLQNNNLLSYKSFLDIINDSTGFGNSGIIIKGVINVTPNSFDFTNSMIYLDGDYLEPVSNLSDVSNYPISGTTFYLVKSSTIEQREAKTSGFMTDFIEKAYFDVRGTKPTTGSYIEIVMENGVNMCSRYLNRVLRYYLAEFGQIQMTIDGKYFDSTGKGKGDMFGFAICNNQNNTIMLNKKFLIGYTASSPTTPTDLSTSILSYATKTNYGKLKNTGGLETVPMLPDNLPSHTHGGRTGKSRNNLKHKHELQVGNFTQLQLPSSEQGKYYGKSQKIAPSTNNSWKYFFTLASQTSVNPSNFKAIKDTTTGLWDHKNTRTEISPNLGDHKHTISNSTVSPTNHNNLPQYVNVIYYEKINP